MDTCAHLVENLGSVFDECAVYAFDGLRFKEKLGLALIDDGELRSEGWLLCHMDTAVRKWYLW